MIAYAAATDVALSFVDKINEVIIFPLIVLLSAVALLIFIWGGFQYVYNAAGSAAHEKGRSHLIYGVIGLLIMVSAYAILEIAANTFDIDVDDSAKGTFSGPEIDSGRFGGAIRSDTPTNSTVTNSESITRGEEFDYFEEAMRNGGTKGDTISDIMYLVNLPGASVESMSFYLDTMVALNQITPEVRSRVLADLQ